MINSVGSAFTVSDTSSARDYRADDSAEAQSFAGILSGAMHAPAPRPEESRRKEGTSELDKPESHDDDEKETDATERAKKKPHHHRAAAASTQDVDQSVADLDPALQEKLARVMQRLQDETGSDAKVAETFRTQTRQDALYAQGRDTTGPVVTWTKNSKHTQGRAVDLVLDGGAAGSDAYQALQRIAAEEGLRTLGARDPGHLELRGNATTASTAAPNAAATPIPTAASDAKSTTPAEPADATGPGQVSIAALAQVARVADVKVEQPATVARVAPVATVASPAAAAQRSAKSDHGSSSSDGSAQGDQRNGYSALSAAVAMRNDSSSQFSAAAVAATTGSTAAERTEKILAALDNAPVRPLSQITMSVDAGNGATDRIHLAMRGSSLNTTIDTSDARVAQAITTHSDDLVRSLNKDGIQLDSLRVRGAVETTSGVAATTAGQASQSANDAASHSRYDRSDAWGQRQDQQDQQDRQRSQQERGSGRQQPQPQQQQQQQRRQRGGQQ